MLLQIGAASLLQIGASAGTNLVSYYKLEERLLQNRETITNWDKKYIINWGRYYQLGQLLQIGAMHFISTRKLSA